MDLPAVVKTTFSGMIRDARMSQGMSQGALEQKSGISRTWLTLLECGHTKDIKFSTLLRLLNGLNLRPELILRRPDTGEQYATVDMTTGDGYVPLNWQQELEQMPVTDADEALEYLLYIATHVVLYVKSEHGKQRRAFNLVARDGTNNPEEVNG